MSEILQEFTRSNILKHTIDTLVSKYKDVLPYHVYELKQLGAKQMFFKNCEIVNDKVEDGPDEISYSATGGCGNIHDKYSFYEDLYNLLNIRDCKCIERGISLSEKGKKFKSSF